MPKVLPSARVWFGQLLLPTIFVLASALLLIMSDRLFRVRSIFCTLDNRTCGSEMSKFLARFQGKNILLLQERQVAELVRQGNPSIKEVKIKKKLPSTVLVESESRKPFVWLTSRESSVLVLDREGVILSVAGNPFVLPELVGVSPSGQIGDQLSGKVRLLIDLVEALEKAFISSQRLILNQENIRVVLKDSTQVLISTDRDFASQVRSLQLILEGITMGERPVKPKEIDVRFQNPVLR